METLILPRFQGSLRVFQEAAMDEGKKESLARLPAGAALPPKPPTAGARKAIGGALLGFGGLCVVAGAALLLGTDLFGFPAESKEATAVGWALIVSGGADAAALMKLKALWRRQELAWEILEEELARIAASESGSRR